LSKSLKDKTITALIWTALDTVVVKAVGLVISVIIARLLSPSDYGVIGMLAIFIAIAQSMVDGGFGAALIQRKNVTSTDYSTIFYFNIVIALIMYLALYFSAEVIASFYNEPRLILLSKVLGLSFVINSFALIQRTILTKELDFKTQMKISVISVIISGVVGVYLAYAGYGVFALVFQVLFKSAINSILLWVLNSWRPSLVFSIQSFKSLFSFGSRLLFSGILDVIFKNLSVLVIGKVFSTQSLGFYTKAKELQTIPSSTLTLIIQKVSFPSFSKIQDDNEKLLRNFARAQQLAVFVIFPVMCGILVTSDALIELLLTEKWLPAVPYLKLLCVVGAFYPIHALNLNILNVKGRSDLFLRLEIVKKTLTVLVIFITYRWGITAMIYGQIFQSVICLFINSYYSNKLIGYGVYKQVKDIMPCSVITLVMMGFTYFVGSILDCSLFSKFLVQMVVAVVLYIGSAYLFKIEAFMEICRIVSEKIVKRKKHLYV
jgi:O-antigen/teichoic acid export membrane protein